MAIRIGRWDCLSCGHKGTPGPNTHCERCGAPRDPKVTFYLPDDEPEVSNKEQIQEALSGADWKCNYCGSENKSIATHCKSCGNIRDHEDSNRNEKVIYDEGSAEYHEEQLRQKRNSEKENRATFFQERHKETTKGTAAKWTKRLAIVIGSLVFLVFSVWWCFHPSTSMMTVEKHYWCFSQQVQLHKLVTEKDFSIPPGAKLIAQTTKVYSYNRVPDGRVQKTRQVKVKIGSRKVKVGKKDMGNGYFKDVYRDEPTYSYKTETYYETKYREVPVYKPYYTYEIYRWVDARARDSLQGHDSNPRFPNPTLPDTIHWKIISPKTYFALFVKDDSGKNHQIEVTETQFYHIKDGDKQLVSQNNLGNMWISNEERHLDD